MKYIQSQLKLEKKRAESFQKVIYHLERTIKNKLSQVEKCKDGIKSYINNFKVIIEN